VEYAVVLNGSSPGLDFYNAQSLRDQAKLNKLFQWLGDHGWINNDQKFKPIEGTEFFEFKERQIRMPCFRRGNLMVVTHGFIKKTGPMPPQEIVRARRIAAEDSARSNHGDGPHSCQ
jgi:hypothetical protein